MSIREFFGQDITDHAEQIRRMRAEIAQLERQIYYLQTDLDHVAELRIRLARHGVPVSDLIYDTRHIPRFLFAIPASFDEDITGWLALLRIALAVILENGSILSIPFSVDARNNSELFRQGYMAICDYDGSDEEREREGDHLYAPLYSVYCRLSGLTEDED